MLDRGEKFVGENTLYLRLQNLPIISVIRFHGLFPVPVFILYRNSALQATEKISLLCSALEGHPGFGVIVFHRCLRYHLNVQAISLYFI